MKVLILASPIFNHEELLGAIEVLRARHISFEVVSTITKIRNEKDPSHKLIIHGKIRDYFPRLDEFDGFIITSGGGPDVSRYFWADLSTLNSIDWMYREGRLLAAICTGVPSLRYCIEGLKFNCWPSYEIVKMMTDNGGIHTKLSVVWDKTIHDSWIVTAEHQQATPIWTETIIELLQGKEPSLKQEFAFDVNVLKRETRRRKFREEKDAL